MNKRARVIIANGGFLPAKTYGGPVVSIDNLCSFLHEDIDFFVICTNHELGVSQKLDHIVDGWNDRGNCKVRYFADAEVTKEKLKNVVDEINPDTIYINSLFDAMWTIPLLKIAKEKGIKVLLAPRGQLCKNAFNGKYKKIPYIIYLKTLGLLKNVHFQSTSEEETGTIKKYLGGTDERIHFLTNLPSLPKVELTHPKKEPGKASFVFFSRIVPKKNLISAIKFFEGIKGEVSFDIYGPIEDEGYWKECQSAISELPENIDVKYKGLIDHDLVFNVLSQYDAFLFPTWSENFGHVISEALFSECPAIISDQTPWRELEGAGAGWDIALDDKKNFRNAIQTIVNNNDVDENLCRTRAVAFAKQSFDLPEMKRKYTSALTI